MAKITPTPQTGCGRQGSSSVLSSRIHQQLPVLALCSRKWDEHRWNMYHGLQLLGYEPPIFHNSLETPFHLTQTKKQQLQQDNGDQDHLWLFTVESINSCQCYIALSSRKLGEHIWNMYHGFQLLGYKPLIFHNLFLGAHTTLNNTISNWTWETKIISGSFLVESNNSWPAVIWLLLITASSSRKWDVHNWNMYRNYFLLCFLLCSFTIDSLETPFPSHTILIDTTSNWTWEMRIVFCSFNNSCKCWPSD